jgi:CheY-like chemotaxis protein
MINGTKKKVLYIEDNLANICLVEAIFQAHPNLQLLTAPLGSIGVELARQQSPDLVLLDLNLPDMHGEECLRQLRGIEALAKVPVIIVSADAMCDTSAHALGVAEYLDKPFDLTHFEETVDRYLGITKTP